MIRDLLYRLRALFRRSSMEAELDRELRAHLDHQVEKHIQSGLSPEEAARRARLEFGGLEQVKEEVRDSWGVRLINELGQDLRYGLRQLRRNPGFTGVAVLTLALGIGANTAIFSVTYGILLKPLPYSDSSRLVQLWRTTASPQSERVTYMPVRDFREIRSQSTVFDQLAEYQEGGCTITGTEGPEGAQTSFVSGNFRSTLGARPLLGRPILPADAEPGQGQVAVLSYDLWQRRYGGDPRIVGKQITIANRTDSGSSREAGRSEPYTVVGVLPTLFPFPNLGDILLPETSWDRQFGLIAIGRLKHGISLAAVNTQLHTIASRLATESSGKGRNLDFSVGLLRDRMSEGYSTELLTLLGAVGFVLLLACVNVSNLLIARSWTRQSEVAIRAALGAPKSRLIRQFLSESVLLALLGAALGLVLADWGIHLLQMIAPPHTPRIAEVGLDGVVLAYSLGISVLVGILSGLVPALQLTRRELSRALKPAKPALLMGLHSRGPQRLKSLLVVGETSLAFVLVVGSALALRSFAKLMNVRLGFRPAHVLTMYVGFGPTIMSNPARRELAMDEVLDRTRALPGIRNAAFGEWMPIGGSTFVTRVYLEGKTSPAVVQYQPVTLGYFATLGIPLLAGRSFNEGDTGRFTPVSGQTNANSQPSNASPQPESPSSTAVHSGEEAQAPPPVVAIVDEAFAKRYFGGKAPGKQFLASIGGVKPVQVQIVGEVGDTRNVSQSLPPVPTFYVPFAQVGEAGETTLFVQTAANPMAMAKAIRVQVGAVDEGAPVMGIETMDAALASKVAEPRFDTILLSFFGGLGLLLAVVGVYGLISFAVAQRTHEIGVRLALGAEKRDVLKMVVGQGLKLVLVGVAIGIAGALALTRFLASLLYGVKPTDPLTFIVVSLILIAVALVACYIPARRASKVDPIVALRYE